MNEINRYEPTINNGSKKKANIKKAIPNRNIQLIINICILFHPSTINFQKINL